MCIAAYENRLGDAHRMNLYPAKKRRPSYSEDWIESQVNTQSTSPAPSEDSEASSSCTFALPAEARTPCARSCCDNAAEYIPKLVMGITMPENGWFSKCRGCGAMTGQELQCPGCSIPLCARCQVKVKTLTGDGHHKMVENLSYVHTCWSKMGL